MWLFIIPDLETLEKEDKQHDVDAQEGSTINIPKSVFGDYYLEFGLGTPRQTGESKASGLLFT